MNCSRSGKLPEFLLYAAHRADVPPLPPAPGEPSRLALHPRGWPRPLTLPVPPSCPCARRYSTRFCLHQQLERPPGRPLCGVRRRHLPMFSSSIARSFPMMTSCRRFRTATSTTTMYRPDGRWFHLPRSGNPARQILIHHPRVAPVGWRNPRTVARNSFSSTSVLRLHLVVSFPGFWR